MRYQVELPDGYKDCLWCGDPSRGMLCRYCMAQINDAEDCLPGWEVYEIRRHSQWGVQLLVEIDRGNVIVHKTHMAPWTFVEKAARHGA